MKNPFLVDGFLCLNASINKLIIEKMPTDKVKQDLRGMSAMDIFSTNLFIEEIKKNRENLNLDVDKVDEKMLPQYLNNCLDSDNLAVNNAANGIVKLFGERLAIILLTLKKGERINRLKRKDWNDSNWDYWSQLKNVILVGGLASQSIGEKLKYYAEEVFIESNEKCYNLILSKDSSNVAIKGCTTYIRGQAEEKTYLILDCGQTFIKRSLVKIKQQNIVSILELNKVLSKHVIWEFEDSEEERIEATKLHAYILNLILETVADVNAGIQNIGRQIVISIANYVKNGLLADRGGYGKLRLLSNNYEEYLSDSIYKKLKIRIKITMVHDGTAMAAAFSNYPNSVCISLGTAFGVGFPLGK